MNTVDGLVPVIKGNGYGFGRSWLSAVAAEFCDTVAVGTIHELEGVREGLTTVVLTPTLVAPASTAPVLTVGNAVHIDALADWNGRVIVKLESAMRRFGGDASLIEHARQAGLDVVGVSFHPPLAGSNQEHADSIVAALTDIDPSLDVWVSHVDPTMYASLPRSHRFRLRLGTLLWHGDKSALHLRADVLEVRPVHTGETAGYRLAAVPCPGNLVMIGAGSAHGVAPLADGASPFHFSRQRLSLHEPPHMHTSMAFVPEAAALPAVGDWVDVQRPLHMTDVDEYQWL